MTAPAHLTPRRALASHPDEETRYRAASSLDPAVPPPAERRDPALADDAVRLAAGEADPLVARAFAEAARAMGRR